MLVRTWFTPLVVLILAGMVRADLTVGPLFTEGAVLQRDRPLRVWGTAHPGERVSVDLGPRHGRTVADDEGRWTVTLEAQEQSEAPLVLKIRGSRGGHLEIADVLIGDVWICSGQSNMAWPLSGALDARSEVAEARHARIRLITVPRRGSEDPQEDFAGMWLPCTPANAKSFSAVGYFFGRELSRELEVPIGLVNTSYGGTPAEAWISDVGLSGEPGLAPLLSRWKAKIEAFDPDAAAKAYEAALAKWKAAARAAREAGDKPPRRPRAPVDPRSSAHCPSALFNGMVAPLLPFAVRGVVWYQGESNAARADQYRTIFPLLIRDWRRVFARDDLPFYFVQLANFQRRTASPGVSAWAELRDAQLETLREVPNSGMAVAIDIGEADSIHPKNKQEVGRRLALWALAGEYGRDVVPSGPLYRSHEVRDGEVVIEFDYAQGGLKSVGELRGFAIAGADHRFVWANARIEGETVIVSHPDVPEPRSVRYAWANNPEAPLVNAAGLPASPFRTDDWPGTTAGRD